MIPGKKLYDYLVHNTPLATLVCKALASAYNNVFQVICEFIDNSVSNLMAHCDDPSLISAIHIKVRKDGDNVDIIIEDCGTGMENIDAAMTLCDTSHRETPLNMSGCGFKCAVAFIEAYKGIWECFTRTKKDLVQNRHLYFTAPYNFGHEVFHGEYRTDWVGDLDGTGTVIHLNIPMDVFETLRRGNSEDKPTFQQLVNIFRENLRYTYSQILLDQDVIMELTVEDDSGSKAELLEGLVPIWTTKPIDMPVHKIDFGGGQVDIHCQYGTIQADPDNLFYYKANMEGSGAEIAINGRVIAHGLMREIWNRRLHNSQNGFLVRVNLTASNVSAIPMTKAAKNGFREADPKLKKLFRWIRNYIDLPPKENTTKEMRLKQKLKEKLDAQSELVNTRLDKVAFESINAAVRVDVYEAWPNMLRIYECKVTNHTSPLDLYQLRMYWDACVKDGNPPDEAILIGNRHSEDVLHLAKYLNTLCGTDGRPYRFSLTTWKEQEISL